jgi:hypothetical protein
VVNSVLWDKVAGPLSTAWCLVTDMWSLTPTPSYVFIAWCLSKGMTLPLALNIYQCDTRKMTAGLFAVNLPHLKSVYILLYVDDDERQKYATLKENIIIFLIFLKIFHFWPGIVLKI